MKKPLLLSTTSACLTLFTGSLAAGSFAAPDFNGDGRSDLAQVYTEDGALQINFLHSKGERFKERSIEDASLVYNQTQRWFHGDFDGDGRSDVAVIFEADGRMHSHIYASSNDFDASVWADGSGSFDYTDKWFSADFDGDSKTDLARVYIAKGKRSVEVYIAGEGGFSKPTQWLAAPKAFDPNDVWLTGQFDRKAGVDFAIVEAGKEISIKVLASSGSAFEAGSSYTSKNPRHLSIKWVAEDFSGDGLTEIAALWNDEDALSVDVYSLDSGEWTQEAWAEKIFEFDREQRWFVGDFNGDAKVDLAYLWNDDGKVSISSLQSNGSRFTVRGLIEQGPEYRHESVYTIGDFDGDRRSDVVITWSDAVSRRDQVLLSEARGLSAYKERKLRQTNYFSRHNIVKPIIGDKFTQYSELRGATPVGADLQAVLDSGNDLLLEKRKIYDTSRTLKYKATYQYIETMDAVFIQDFAMIRQQIDQGDYDTLITNNSQSYIHLERVKVNGNKYMLGQKGKEPNVAQGAMVFISHAEGAWIKRTIMFNARTWSTCHLVESGDAHSHIAEYNYVLGAGDDPRGCGKYVDANGVGISSPISIGWSDGFSISATKVTARHNFIMDCTDVGLVLFGAPGAHVHDNIILNYSRDNHGGINLVDDSSHRYIGTDTTFGKEYPCYDYRNNTIEDNRIVASGCRIQIGMPLGNRTWKRVSPAVFDFEGSVIRNNSIEGNSMGYGYVLDYVKNLTFYGNTSTATHTGIGRGTSDNDYVPDPAMAFLWDPDHVHIAEGGKFQGGFTENEKPIEHLLFHNGTPLTNERYHYYEYTEEEAIEMVIASYLEMLGRAPTEQELLEGKNSFLVDPKPDTLINEADKQYGDLFKRELMKTPEFIERFGQVSTQNLQSFRTARWEDRINALDYTSIIETGNYAAPKYVYEDVLAALEWNPSKFDAEIVEVTGLPETLAQGERVMVSVTVKNTGKGTWSNTSNDPQKILLSTVGASNFLGASRAYLPDGVEVKRGKTYTFELEVFPQRIPFAGRGQSTSTALPFDVRMQQKAVGFFGETLTSHLGGQATVAVDHSSAPPPAPIYNAGFISQTLQGDPQVNGIRPGEEFAVNLTFKNSSAETTKPWSKAGRFSIGSENSKDNFNWGTNRIHLEPSRIVRQGEQTTIYTTLKAPKEPGEYNFQWQMLGAGWFGQMSENLVIEVRNDAAAISAVKASVDMKAPATAKPSTALTATVEVENEGEDTWPVGALKLANAPVFVDFTDRSDIFVTSEHDDSVPEEIDSMLIDNDVSTKYFTRNSSAWVQFTFEGGPQKLSRYAIISAPDEGPGEEMIANGGFEDGPEGWSFSGSSITTEESVSGTSSLKMEHLGRQNVPNTTITIPNLKPDTNYVLSFWMKQAPDTQGAFVLDTNDVFDKTCQWVVNGGKATEWTRYRGEFNTAITDSPKKPANPDSLTLRIRANKLLGTCYVDNISLIEVGAGGTLGDPQEWRLEASADGQKWVELDSQTGVEFSGRNQRLEFDVEPDKAYADYRLSLKNKGGDTLQFAELELLGSKTNQLHGDVTLSNESAVEPGASYQFEYPLTSPEAKGDYEFQLKVDLEGESAIRLGTPAHKLTVQ